MNPKPEVIALAAGDPLKDPSLARELAQRYLVWDGWVGGQRRVDLHPLVLPVALHDAAVKAAEDVTAAVGRVAARAHDDEDERRSYRLHDDVLHLARASHEAGDDSSLVRVDLLLDERGEWQACEINADCPGGHNEALGLPRLARAAGYMGGHNPTVVTHALAERLATLADGGAVALIFATAYAEDLQVCAIIHRTLREMGVPAILTPATAPRLVRGELSVGAAPVRVLYRYFPTEYMQGQSNVEAIAGAVRRGRVRSMTSFAHIYEQSKLAFARAWRHAPSLPEDERDAVMGHTPETFDVRHMSRDELILGRARWVLKKAYGRVGDEVFVGPLIPPESWPRLVDGVLALSAGGESWIAQRFVRQTAIATPWGPRFVTLGAYVLNGEFVGYFARITPESHVSHDALVVPVFHLPRKDPAPTGNPERDGKAA